MIQEAFAYVEQTPDLETKLKLIDTLRTVTAGKVTTYILLSFSCNVSSKSILSNSVHVNIVHHKMLSIHLNWPARLVSLQMDCTNLHGKFYSSPLNFVRIVCTILGD